MKSKYSDNSSTKQKLIDSTIEKYFKIITEEVKKLVPENNLHSLLLIGGFARGEGSVIVKNNNIEPLNDFDIFIITKDPLNKEIDLKKFSIDCLKKCKIQSNFSFEKSLGIMQFYIDFRNITIDELKKEPPFIKYYEARNSGLVFYGPDSREFIPDYKLSDIPLEEGLRHMFNRLSLLLEYLIPGYETINNEKKKTAVFFVGKCYLSIAEALLLYSGDFVCSYKKRSEIFSKIYKEKFPELQTIIPDLDKKIVLYTNQKLNPDPKNINITKLWYEARDDTIKVIEYYMNLIYKNQKHKLYNNNNNNIIDFSTCLEKKLKKRLLLKYMHYYLLGRGLNINNRFLLRFLNTLGGYYLNYLFFKEQYKHNKVLNPKLLFSTTDPGIKFYTTMILLISSIDQNKTIDPIIFNKAFKSLKRLNNKIKIKYNINNQIDFNTWKNLCEDYTNTFRIYQFLKV